MRRLTFSPRAALCSAFIILPLFLSATQASAQSQVEVDFNQERQTMDGCGGNVYGWISDASKWDPKVVDLILHDIEGYRYREIAELTEVAEGTVKSQLNRARRLVREALLK